MKKLLTLSALACLLSYAALAQQTPANRTEEYCEFNVKSPIFSKKFQAHVDYGNGNEVMKDAQGKPMEFSSPIGVMNYMNAQGWELVNVHVWVNDGDGQTYYVMKRKL